MKTRDTLTEQQLMDLSALFGRAPVLATEEAQNYEKLWHHLIDCLKPRDFLELVFINQVQNEVWKILRYTRYQSVGIERRFHQSLQFQVQRRKEQKVRREALAKEWQRKLAGRSPTLNG